MSCSPDQSSEAGLPSREAKPVSVEFAAGAASELRAAEIKFDAVVNSIARALDPKDLDIVIEGIEVTQKRWLSKLVKSLGDPKQVHFAVHSELEASMGEVVKAVRRAWGEIFEVESRPTWDKQILLTLRPKGGRQATAEDMRPAVPQDIVVGQRVYIMHGDHKVLYEQRVTDVRNPGAGYKGFTADDGRRYGLDGSVFILNSDDTQI